MPKLWSLALGACLMLGVLPAKAAVVEFAATLDGSHETPPNASPGVGFGTFFLDDQGTASTSDDTLAVNLTFSGLTAPASAAHIHLAPVGVAGPVVLSLVGGGFPTGVTSGTFSHTFLLSTDLTGVAVGTFEAALEAGDTYVNIHDANFPAGEIRGQLTAVAEPTTLGFFGVGIVALAFRRRAAG